MNTWNTDSSHRNNGINTSSQVSTQNSDNNNKNQCAKFQNCTTLENLLTTRFLPEKVLHVLVAILRTLILSILCIPKMISTFSLPFHYEGGGCPSTTCLVCTASRSIHTLQWEEVPHYGSLEAEGESSFRPKCVFVCVFQESRIYQHMKLGEVRDGKMKEHTQVYGGLT